MIWLTEFLAQLHPLRKLATFAELLRSPLKTVEPGFFTKRMSYRVRKHKEKRGSMYSFTCYLHKHMQKIVPWRTLGTFTL